jgi:hypothetical protein
MNILYAIWAKFSRDTCVTKRPHLKTCHNIQELMSPFFWTPNLLSRLATASIQHDLRFRGCPIISPLSKGVVNSSSVSSYAKPAKTIALNFKPAPVQSRMVTRSDVLSTRDETRQTGLFVSFRARRSTLSVSLEYSIMNMS